MDALLRQLQGDMLPRNKRPVAYNGSAGLVCVGCTIGLVENPADGVARESKATRQRPELARLLCRACSQADPDFRFTSIQVNLNTRYGMHTDGEDAGPSRMVCFGNFSRGRLWLHNWQGQEWQPIDARERWIAFDGREFHFTEEWDGPERYSLVYFTHPAWCSSGLQAEAKQRLEELGFPWPEPGDVFPELLPPPRERSAAAEKAMPPHLLAAERRLPERPTSARRHSAVRRHR